MHTAKVSLLYPEPSIGVISMHDEECKNTLSPLFVADLKATVEAIEQHAETKVIILKGTPEIFCAGADRATLSRFVTGQLKPTEITLPRILFSIPVPVIAAMEGHAVGGGFALGLCADLIVISESSRYGCNFMNMGFTPGMGTTKLLENVLSPTVAHELLYTGELRKGRDFRKYADFNAILPKVEVFAKAMEMATRIAEKPKSSLELLKSVLSLPKRKCFEETLTLETIMHQVSFADPMVQRRISEAYIAWER
ncbi:MAG: polyketide synthase [Amoebophilaceae bacterium]|jgi:polyketide biosynthesis enoyl-CoA hydratase PksI|nr:polyketide synthase [Amoebophilaceae bacterium]